jgi:hydrogenase maturation protein HypF
VKRRWRIEVRGTVQGVGFRPFIYREAVRLGLAGSVRNRNDGVEIDAEGDERALQRLVRNIGSSPPPMARVESLKQEEIPPDGTDTFSILPSLESEEKCLTVPPDIATCADCAHELFDRRDRRYRYPFINCVNCGPRFTIVKRLPYDRGGTTMSSFTMCPECAREYHNPLERRFHAQPNACAVCGPRLQLLDSKGGPIEAREPVRFISVRLREGAVVAIKGLGGYHLACDATNDGAVRMIRERKGRDAKPFAVMMAGIEMARASCAVSNEEEELLLSPGSPIVLLKKRDSSPVSEPVAPARDSLGVMLPYSPLHLLLMREAGFPLVMTSANESDEPILFRDEEARGALRGRADYILLHDRPIHAGCDDSVVRLWWGNAYFLRRARGYVPGAVRLPMSARRGVLATGGQLKNTVCIVKGDRAYPGQHVGTISSPRARARWLECARNMCELLMVEPEVIACDAHPDYVTTRRAHELYKGERRNVAITRVQHHHAHIAACLADNGVALRDGEKVIGVAWDGLGFGEDRTLWGGEFLLADYHRYERCGFLEPVPMPGGEKAVAEPWRMAVAYMHACGLMNERVRAELSERWGAEGVEAVIGMIRSKLNCPLTSSAGRLFDAVAALCGIRDRVSYEGQAAVELESVADGLRTDRYDFGFSERNGVVRLGAGELLAEIRSDLEKGRSLGVISARFHNALAAMIVQTCASLRQGKGCGRVALSGGVFQNMLLLEKSYNMLIENGFDVYTHHQVPCHDGGLSLGQAAVAVARDGEEYVTA